MSTKANFCIKKKIKNLIKAEISLINKTGDKKVQMLIKKYATTLSK